MRCGETRELREACENGKVRTEFLTIKDGKSADAVRFALE